jgi:hypothetical protein
MAGFIATTKPVALSVDGVAILPDPVGRRRALSRTWTGRRESHDDWREAD